ncbi:ABC transporter permease subunit [Solirubrobacter phytolaccae]|uniref:ABC transporter permease subunit n=1 Tax=Solirubrobacter phytolaccae TaxID=1404360 RepID=A0A9X3N630_9ACTN|nr:ABC transporter permease subunit [Solirubrobacter phytolaccae]MDA0180353.1 ABC transporter permease subunit [Solirubrobacter phytolaccae]
MTAVTYPRVIASEITKLHSLRSSRLSMLIALGLVVGLGVLVPWMSVTSWRNGSPTVGYDAVGRTLSGIYLAQIAFGVLGAMVITGEYATGSIRSTFAAVPRRLPVLWSKLGVFLVSTLVLGTLASVIAFFCGQAIFATKDVDAALGDPHVLRAVLGCGLFLAAMGALGLALGALLRNTAAAITTLSMVLFVVPIIVDLTPKGEEIGPYLPSAAGLTITQLDPGGPLSAWGGFGVLCAYVAATIALAAFLLVRRDA